MASAAQRRIKAISYAKYGYMFIAPFFLVYFFFQLWPLINTFILSFSDYEGTNVIGMANYKAILFSSETISDEFTIKARTAKQLHENFVHAFGNTVILWVGNFIPQIALSLSLAVWFTDANLKIPGTGFFKVVMYLPNIITAASVAVLFLQLCGEAENAPGALNLLLSEKDAVSEKYDTIKFITGAWQSRGVVMFIQTWMWFGNTMIMLMSGIQGINPSLFEAASIDGATSGQVFRKITLPLLSPILAYTLVTSMIGGLQMFDIPYLYHKGTSINTDLETVAVFIYRNFHTGQKNQNYGWSGAASVLLFIVTLILGCITFYLNRDTDEIAKKKQRKKLAKQAKIQNKQFGGLSL